MNQSHKDILAVLGYFFLCNGKVPKAHAVFKALCELFPDEPRFSKSLSYTHLLMGEYEQAVRQGEKCIRNGSNDADRAACHLLLSKGYRGTGQTEKARYMLNRFMNWRERTHEDESG